MSINPKRVLIIHGLKSNGSESPLSLALALHRYWPEAEFVLPSLTNTVRNWSGEDFPEDLYIEALAELNSRVAFQNFDMVIGFSYGGFLGALTYPELTRFAIASSWSKVPKELIAQLNPEQLFALHGAKDVLIDVSNLKSLPNEVAQTIDPNLTHDFRSHIPSITDWILTNWQKQVRIKLKPQAFRQTFGSRARKSLWRLLLGHIELGV